MMLVSIAKQKYSSGLEVEGLKGNFLNEFMSMYVKNFFQAYSSLHLGYVR